MPHEPNDREHYFDDPRHVRLVLRSLFTVCAVMFLLDFAGLFLHWAGAGSLRHAATWWEGLPGFYAIYGFAACVFLVLAAKQLRKLLKRDEDYYDG
jgi:hypothetical protein